MTLSFPLVFMDSNHYTASMHCIISAKNFFSHKKKPGWLGFWRNLISLREHTSSDFSADDKIWMSTDVHCIYLDILIRGQTPPIQSLVSLPGWKHFCSFLSHTHPDHLCSSLEIRVHTHEKTLSQELGQAIGQESFPWYMTNITWIYRYLCDQCFTARKNINTNDHKRQSRLFFATYGVNPWINEWKELPSYRQFLNRLTQLPLHASIITGVHDSQPWRHHHYGIRLAQTITWQPRLLKLLWFACVGVIVLYTSWPLIIVTVLLLIGLGFAHRVTLGMLKMEANRWAWHTQPHQFLSRRIKLLYMLEKQYNPSIAHQEGIMMQGLAPFIVQLSDEIMLTSLHDNDPITFKKLIRSYHTLGLWGVWSYRSSRLQVLHGILRDYGSSFALDDETYAFLRAEEIQMKKRFWSRIWYMGGEIYQEL